MTVFKDSIYGVAEVSLMPIFHKRIRRHTESYIINKRNGTQATSIRRGTQSTTKRCGTQSTNKRNGTQSTSIRCGTQSTNKRNGTQATSIRCGTQFPLEISVPYCLCKLI